MKLTLFFLLTCFGVMSQTINHPTIAKFDVVYKESSTSQIDTIKTVRIHAFVTLTNEASVSDIYFKVRDNLNNSIVYEVTYPINSSIITNEEGIVIFKREGLDFFIVSSSELPLNYYLYEISTKDSQGVLTEVYSSLK
jgi:hypothetical protein